MGRDKASLRVAGAGLTLARRTASILSSVCFPALEVGPGHTELAAVSETPPGEGPLVAVASGWAALTAGGWHGPVVVVATDLPRLTAPMVAWLAESPRSGSVVPVVAGRVQPLCARYSPTDLDTATALVASGRRAMTALLDEIRPQLVGETEWAPLVGGPGVLADVDTPDDLRRMYP